MEKIQIVNVVSSTFKVAPFGLASEVED